MQTGKRLAVAGVLGFAVALSACADTSRVTETVTNSELARSRTAVALVKIGSADPMCTRAAVLVGVRDGANFRAVKQIDVVGLRSPFAPAVSEVELAAGEYHVLGYSCATAAGKQFAFSSSVENTYRASLASFRLAEGEIVNVGYLQVHARPARRNVLSRTVPLNIAVTDWPMAEIERFRQQRPNLFAAMTVRLMTVTPNAPVREDVARECSELKALQAAGKVQELPARCRPAGQGQSRQKA